MMPSKFRPRFLAVCLRNIIIMKKHGIALLLTLLFIATTTVLIAILFGLTDKALQRGGEEHFMTQADYMLYDIRETVLPIALQFLNDPAVVQYATDADKIAFFNDLIYDLPFPLLDDPELGSVTVTIRPDSVGLNLNRLKNLDFDRAFLERYFMEVHYLRDPALFFDLVDLVLQTERDGYGYLESDKSLPVNDPFYRKGELVNFRQFQGILESYVQLTDDEEILKIPWKELLDFDNRVYVDFHHMAPEYCKMLFPERNPSWWEEFCTNPMGTVYKKDDLYLSNTEESWLIEHNATFTFNPQVKCLVRFVQNGQEGDFTFRYNLETNATSGFQIKL